MNLNSSLYRKYVSCNAKSIREATVNEERRNLLESMLDSPDYHPDALRNGATQGMIFTRGGEKHSYNVVCKPGDELFAGDIIDAFDSKWIVMEARADSTTHKSGIMWQCNYVARFQNHTPMIYERYGFLDISGYSSSFNNNVQLQKGEEQVVMYLPLDSATEKIFVDKRLPSHKGFDPDGNEILFTFNVTGVNPVSESYNAGDHLMMIKAVRGLYSPEKDSLEYGLCDYIAPAPIKPQPVKPDVPQQKLRCEIKGRDTIRIGTTRTYCPTFYSESGQEVSGIVPKWTIENQVSTFSNEENAKIFVEDDADRIGDIITIHLGDESGCYEDCTMEVEVVGIG